jgi:hypothetical protein
MNINPHNQGIASVLRAEIEAWRRAGNISREAVAAMVMEAHVKLGGEAATGVEFTFVGDTYTQAKKGAQKLFRWLDADGTLPAGMVQSILEALPLDVRLHCLNQMFRGLGVEVRIRESVTPGQFDGFGHLRSMIKENSEAQTAVVLATNNPTTANIKAAIKEVREAAEADLSTLVDLEAQLLSADPEPASL